MDTPTRLPPPPRVVHGGPGGQIWFLRIFILPHMAAGVGMAAFFVLTVAVALFGTETNGTVLGTRTSHSSKGGTTYHLTYRYYAGWRCWTNSTTVSWNLFARLSGPRNLEGDPVLIKLKYLALGPAHYQLLTEEGQVWKQAGDCWSSPCSGMDLCQCSCTWRGSRRSAADGWWPMERPRPDAS